MGLGLTVLAGYLIVQSLAAAGVVTFRILANPLSSLSRITQNLTSDGLVISLAILASTIVGMGLIIVFVRMRRQAGIGDYLGLRPIGKKAILVSLAVPSVLILLSETIDALFVKSSSAKFLIDAYMTSAWPPLLWAAVVVFAPVFEEAFFRGFVFVGLQPSRIGPAGTIAVTALAWTLLHTQQYDAFGMATVLAGGIALGVLRLSTGSLWSPLLMHFFWNLVAMTQTVLHVYGLIG